MWRKCGTQVYLHVISDVHKLTDNGPLSRRKPFDFRAHGAVHPADVCIVSNNAAVCPRGTRAPSTFRRSPARSSLSVVPSNNLLHSPETPDGARWAPLVINRHGKWEVDNTILVQKLDCEIAQVYRRSQMACQRWIFKHVNAVLMHTFVCSAEPSYSKNTCPNLLFCTDQ